MIGRRLKNGSPYMTLSENARVIDASGKVIYKGRRPGPAEPTGTVRAGENNGRQVIRHDEPKRVSLPAGDRCRRLARGWRTTIASARGARVRVEVQNGVDVEADGVRQGVGTLAKAPSSVSPSRSAVTATRWPSGRRWRRALTTGINGNQDDHSAFGAGAVYVYVRRGNGWSQQAYIKASNTGQDDQSASTSP